MRKLEQEAACTPLLMEAQDSATLLWGLMAKKVETASRSRHCPETPSHCLEESTQEPTPPGAFTGFRFSQGREALKLPPMGNTPSALLPMGISSVSSPSLWECFLISWPPLPTDSSGVLHPFSALIQPHSGHTLAHTHLPHLPSFHLKGPLPPISSLVSIPLLRGVRSSGRQACVPPDRQDPESQELPHSRPP